MYLDTSSSLASSLTTGTPKKELTISAALSTLGYCFGLPDHVGKTLYFQQPRTPLGNEWFCHVMYSQTYEAVCQITFHIEAQ